MKAVDASPNCRASGGIPMRCRRFRKLVLLIALGATLLPALLWLVIVLLAPTSWARSHVIAALEDGSGRSVQLDDLRVCLRGCISLQNLRISAPGAAADPWFKAETIEIDVSPIQLLCGRFEPSRLDVEGATLRVYRRTDGSLELSDLVSPRGERAGSTTAEESTSCGSHPLEAHLRKMRVILIDEQSQTQMTLDDVKGEGTREDDGSLRFSLSGLWNQGPFQLTAQLDRSVGQPFFDGQFRASEVVMDQGMSAIRYAVPVLAGAPVELKGRLGANVYLSGRGRTGDEIRKSLTGRGSLSLDPISLEGTPLVAEFARIAGQSKDDAVGSIYTDLVIKDQRLSTDHLTMTLGRVPVNVAGWTDFTGKLDYQVKLDTLTSRIPEKAREYLSGLDVDVDTLTALHLTGTVDRVAIRPFGTGREGRNTVERIIGPEDRQRLKVLGRQLRDKFLR